DPGHRRGARVSAWNGLAAVVTGASGGIGEELAVQLAAAGANVTIAARRTEELERVAARCRAARSAAGAGTATARATNGPVVDGAVLAVPCDVSDRAQCEALVARAVTAFGRLDVLVNNAGQGFWGRAEDVRDYTVFERMLRTNYLSVVWMTLAALPHLKATRGRILTVGSLSGKLGVPMRSAYAASKHAMTGFLDTLRIEVADSGVTVTTIHPGFVTTGSQARNLGPDGAPLGAMPVAPNSAISPAECARLLLGAGAARRRDVYPSFAARLSQWLRLVAPGRVDRMVSGAIQGRR
ncbi:MAG: SDR family oxidoreductase, partial [Gemmatimonadota bacterium]|nr:SDR family oxidoreductase [Gemmatimonadota bacterium]